MSIQSETKAMLDRALDYIRSRTGSETLSAGEIAAHAGFSDDYFNRIFSAYTGYRVMEYARFYRLRRAAFALRTSDRDVLDIALDMGYGTHESFIRAFRKQYAMTPTEYRETMRKKVMTWGETWADTTAGNRFADAHPRLAEIPRDDAIEYLLNKNSIKFGYDAITLAWNGSFVYTENDSSGGTPAEILTGTGDYIAVDGYPNGEMHFQFHLSHPEKLGRYLRMILPFPCGGTAGVSFTEDLTEEDIRLLLEKDGLAVQEIRAHPAAVYTGEIPEPVVLPAGYSIHVLTEADIPAVQKWGEKRGGSRDWGLTRELSITPDMKADHALGLFWGNDLYGVSRLCFQETHGLQFCNCICSDILKEYRDPALYRLMYRNGMRYAMEHGYLPYEDMLFGEDALAREGFTAADMGYVQIHTAWGITAAEKE